MKSICRNCGESITLVVDQWISAEGLTTACNTTDYEDNIGIVRRHEPKNISDEQSAIYDEWNKEQQSGSR